MNHRPRKRFAQHFLGDAGVIGNILTCINPQPGEHLVEIGPGKGAITTGLLSACRALDAVELDRDLIEPLQDTCAGIGRLKIINADALSFDFCRLVQESEALRLVGNLPYNISTPILFHLLDQVTCIQDMHFMLQKEVVDRMAASPGGKAYGRLSVMLQAYCQISNLFDIPPRAFHPAPRVHSSFVRLVPYTTLPVPIHDKACFSDVVRQAFGQRRKTLRNSLKGTIDAQSIENLGIDPGLRAERLTIGDFSRLADAACKTG